MAGFAGLGDVAHRAVFGRGVVLGDHHHGSGQDDAHQTRAPEVDRRDTGVAHQPASDEPERHQAQHGSDDQSLVQRGHDLAGARVAHKIRADNRGDHRDAAQRQRVSSSIGAVARQGECTQQHGGDHCHCIGFEQVGSHAGAVADVVANVVSDHRRVARVILGNAGLDLAHKVGAHIRALGEDATTQTRKDRDQ